MDIKGGIMFSIHYKITDEDLEFCRNVCSVKEFHDKKDWIYGQFLIKVNENKIGFVYDDLEYDGENITAWLLDLNKVILKMFGYKYVTIPISDWNDSWIEFQRINNHFFILSEVEAHISDTSECIITRELKDKIVIWSEKVSFENYIAVLLKTTKCFLEEINNINSVLNETEVILCLRKVYDSVKEQIKTYGLNI